MSISYDRIKLWIKRYGPGEFRGTLGAMAGGYLGNILSHNYNNIYTIGSNLYNLSSTPTTIIINHDTQKQSSIGG